MQAWRFEDGPTAKELINYIKVLFRTFVFLLCILFSAWLIFIVEHSEKDSVEKKYQLLVSLYELMASKFIMTNEEFYNFSSLAFEAFTEWTQTTKWTSVAAVDFVFQAFTTVGKPNYPQVKQLCNL